MREIRKKNSSVEGDQAEGSSLDRRQFLKKNIKNSIAAAAGVSGAAIITSLLNDSFGPNSSRQKLKQKLEDTYAKLEPQASSQLKSHISMCGSAFDGNQTRALKKAALQGVLLELSKTAINTANTQMQLGLDPVLSKPSDENVIQWFKKDPVKFITFGLILAPVVEEVIFRMFPSEMAEFSGHHGSALSFGIPSALLFSLTHNLTNSPNNGIKVTKNWGIETDRISVPSFISGLIFWGLQRNHGLDASIVAHLSNNATSAALIWLNDFLNKDQQNSTTHKQEEVQQKT